MITPPRARIRRDGGLYTMEDTLRRRGFGLVAGVDEAGRGACAGPLVVAAVVLRAGPGGRIPGVDDSKRLSALEREQVYGEVIQRAAGHAVVVIPAAEVDTVGVGACNLAGMRRAVAGLNPPPEYVLTDGFPVSGLAAPNLAVWKGDQVAASVSAASVLAKVTRDRIMVELDARHPEYGFAEHKGYGTPAHQAALATLGPCPQHRRSYSNVAAHVGVANSAEPTRTAHHGWQ